jgi:predicted MPP superfamily phosphohydrolase
MDISRQICESLRELDARDGIYAVLGNHDHWTDVQAVSDAIREAGIQLMINESAMIERDGERLYIAGVDDIWENKQDLDAALSDIPTDSCVILLAHEPDYADTAATDGRIDLQLSGHSHGGQIRLPLIGAPVLPVLAKHYDQGLYTIQDMKLYVNRGLGMLDPPVRFLCPSEITCMTLRSIPQLSKHRLQ